MPEQERRLYPYCRNFNFTWEETPCAADCEGKDSATKVRTWQHVNPMKKRGIRDTRVQNFGEDDYYVSDKCDESWETPASYSRETCRYLFLLYQSRTLWRYRVGSQSRQTYDESNVLQIPSASLSGDFSELHATLYIESRKIWVVAHCQNRWFDFDISRCRCTSGRFRKYRGNARYQSNLVIISDEYIRMRARIALSVRLFML